MVDKKEEMPEPPVPPVAPAPPAGDKTKGIGIAALICAFLAPFIGLVLGIVGLVMSSKYQNVTGQKAKGKTLSLVATILAPILGIVYIVVFIIAVFGLVFFALDKAKDDLAGTWVCRDAADVTAAYGTQTFTFTSEGGISAALDADPTGNSFRGSFDVTRFNIDNRNRRYAVDVTFDEYLYDGEDILGLYVLPTTEWDIVIPRNNRNEMRINFEMGEAVVCGFEILN